MIGRRPCCPSHRHADSHDTHRRTYILVLVLLLVYTTVLMVIGVNPADVLMLMSAVAAAVLTMTTAALRIGVRA